jgi:lysosomal alpha-mannosidase
MGVMQHHDAVTGTEKQHVANDYSRMLNLAIAACGANTKSSLNQFVSDKVPKNNDNDNDDDDDGGGERKQHGSVSTNNWDFKFDSCLNLNISVCNVTENGNQFIVTVYNPLAHATYQYVRFPVSGQKYEVRDYRNIVVPSQLVPIPHNLKNIDYRMTSTDSELVFHAQEVPAFGYKSYYVSRIMNELPRTPVVIQIPRRDKRKPQPVVIGNEFLNITFDVNGLLSQISIDGVDSKISQNFAYYEGAIGESCYFFFFFDHKTFL